jgi:hypothetical protein
LFFPHFNIYNQFKIKLKMSDNQSATSSVARRRAADKHCNGTECNGKKISAKNYAEHKKAAKHGDEVGFQLCTGSECGLCRDH